MDKIKSVLKGNLWAVAITILVLVNTAATLLLCDVLVVQAFGDPGESFLEFLMGLISGALENLVPRVLA